MLRRDDGFLFRWGPRFQFVRLPEETFFFKINTSSVPHPVPNLALLQLGVRGFLVTSKANKAKTQIRDDQCSFWRHGQFQTKTRQTEREAKTKAGNVSRD